MNKLFVLLLLAFTPLAHAVDCSRQPYGDTAGNFMIFAGQFPPSAAFILQHICEAKFEGGDRSALYAFNFTDQDIEIFGTTALATRWILYADARERVRQMYARPGSDWP